MFRNRRLPAFMLSLLFLFRLSCFAASAENLYFVAVENIVLPLSDDSMPVWYDGYLYISADVFTGTVRDAVGISRAKIGDGVLLYCKEKSLLFRNNYPYAQDTEQNTYTPGMLWHDGEAYVPASVVARYFSLLYSVTDVPHGKLVWLREDSFHMQDQAFAKAATFQLNTVYQEYLKATEPEPLPADEPEPPDEPDSSETLPDEPELTEPPEETSPPVTEEPVTPVQPVTPVPSVPTVPRQPAVSTPSVPASRPVTPAKPANPPQTAVPETPLPETVPDDSPETLSGGQTLYLCLRGDSSTSALLDVLDRHGIRATVLCDASFLSTQGDLLRRMTATGHCIGLYAAPSPSVSDTLDAMNAQLLRVTMEKTRLVYLDGATEEQLRTVRNAGFLCFRPTLDRTGEPLRSSRQAFDLLNLVSQTSDPVLLWLGSAVNRSALNTFLSNALELRDVFLPWDETASL